jgi:tetratricopeptide (TPR) repeat protein
MLSNQVLGLSAIRFAPFELDLRSYELSKNGVPLKLQRQPCRLLALLVSRAGQLVPRDEIRQYIWNDDTFVDFDNGINFCIQQIRLALGGDCRNHCIDTLPRRGYRFRGSVQRVESMSQPLAYSVGIDSRDLPSSWRDLPDANGIASIRNTKPGRRSSGSSREDAALKLDALRAYMEACYCCSKRTEAELTKAIKLFTLAIRKNSNYGLAYTGLADCYVLLCQSGFLPPGKAYPAAKAAAVRAMELDDTLAESHASLAYTRMVSEWEWREAERGFRRAIELNPRSAKAHHFYADFLSAIGDHRHALNEFMLACELDPTSLIMSTDVGWSLCHAGRYREAIEHYRSLIRQEPNFVPAIWGLSVSYLQGSLFREAIDELQKASRLSRDNPAILATLGYAYAISGNTNQARKMLTGLEKLSRLRYVSSYEFATIYLGLHDRNHAFACLDEAYTERSAHLVYIKADARIEMDTADRRFRILLNNVGLPLNN